MKMFVVDTFYPDPDSFSGLSTNQLILRVRDNPLFVPRKGDKVYLGYTPATEVTETIFDFEHDIIIVKCL